LEPASELLERIKAERKKTGKYKELPPLDTTELPELPDGWVWTRVGEISDKIHYGFTASATADAIGPKMLRITDIQNNFVAWEKVPYCVIDSEKKKDYLLKNGDFVFARTGATVGKSFLITREIPDAVFA
jgi:type I restriction enzyme S subunit